VQTARLAAGAAVLPGTLGLLAMGYLNRAQGLLYSTVGRFLPVVIDAVYPILPRLAADRETWPRQALRFVRTLSWALWPAAIFAGLAGPLISRVIYGEKWIAVDPLLWPAAIACVGTMAVATARAVLLAANRLRVCVALDIVEAALTASVVIVAWLGGSMLIYAWAAAIGQSIAGAVYLAAASSLLPRRAWWSVVAPVTLATALAAAATWYTDGAVAFLRPFPRALVEAVVYSAVWIGLMRLAFPRWLGETVAVLPRGQRLAAWLRIAPGADG
jgi:O-antigen/teichoic acid export membrane protein